MGWLYGAFAASITLALMMKYRIRIRAREPAWENKSNQQQRVLVVLCFIPLIFVSACRYQFIDTSDYRSIYEQIGPHWVNAFNNTVPRIEKGFLLLTVILNKFSTNPQLLIIVSSIVTNVFFAIFIAEESDDIYFSIILYSCQLWMSTMNGLRQMLVASVVCLLWRKWVNSNNDWKETLKFIIWILLLSTIHLSVLFALPLFFFARGKILNKWILGIALIASVLLAFPIAYQILFSSILGNTSYSTMVNTEATMGIARFLLNCLPMVFVIIYCFQKKGAVEQNPKVVWMINLTFLSFVFNVLSLRMVYFSRFRMYFGIFTIVIISALLNRCLAKKDAKIVKTIVIILYIGVFLVQMKAFGKDVTEFKLFFE